MNAQVFVGPTPTAAPADPPADPKEGVADLLRQLVGLQQEQVGLLRAQAASQDGASRWRAFLTRWADEFPGIGAACRSALPALERAYLGLVRDLTDRVNAADADLDDEFLLTEFLDRYGLRLGQLGNILSQLGPLAEAATTDTA